MTYKELRDKLFSLTPEQLNCDLTVHMTETDEFLPATLEIVKDGEGVLDDDHPVLPLTGETTMEKIEFVLDEGRSIWALFRSPYNSNEFRLVQLMRSNTAKTACRQVDPETIFEGTQDQISRSFKRETGIVLSAWCFEQIAAKKECEHEPDWSTVRLADGTDDTFDVSCKHCGQSGSFPSTKEILW